MPDVGSLTGAALDAAVARAEGMHIHGMERLPDRDGGDTFLLIVGDGSSPDLLGKPGRWSPSRAWGHGGPIIERERIALLPYAHDGEYEYDATGNNPRLIAPGRWWARLMPANAGGWIEECPEIAERDEPGYASVGPTPLIAAMRAYVASKLKVDL